jgi:hypothetical protein
MENIVFENNLESLSFEEMIEIDGGAVDKNSLSYRIGHAIGTVCGAIEACTLKWLTSIIY